jgi:hypothetical protein
MASQVSPGVVIRERDLSNAVVTGALAIRAAFASTFRTGPVGKIINVNSERELIDTFGTPAEANASDWLVAAEFLRYGGQLAVLRAETTVKNATKSGTGVLVSDKDAFDAGVTTEKFLARYAGTEGNYYRVVIVDRGADYKVAKVGHGLSVGGTFTDNAGVTHEVYDVVDNDNFTIVKGSAVPTSIPTGKVLTTNSVNGTAAAGSASYTNVAYTTNSAAGTGATFNVSRSATAYTVTISGGGSGYVAGDTFTILGTALGGTSPTNDLTFNAATVVTVASTVSAYTNSDWNAELIGSTGLSFKSIGPRPGTSPWASERYLSYDEVHVAVIDERDNSVVERFTYLSKISDAKSPEGNSTYWKSAINEFSNYIYAGQELTSAEITTAGENPGGTAASYAATSGAPKELSRILQTAGGTLSGGLDDFAYSSGEIQAAYDAFLDTEETQIDFVLMGGSMSNETDTIAKAQAVAAIANSRKDCVAFISPYVGNQVATSGGAAITPATQLSNTISFFDNIASSSYIVLDSGIKYTYDRFNDKYRYIGCNGDTAGVCVSTSAILDDWYSPAGLNRGGIQNVVKLAFNPNKAQRDDLYSNRINPIVALPGSGPVLFGDKTALASPSAFDRINVRRLFLNVEKRVKGLAEGVLFEQNDSTTRSNFTASISSYLSEIQARRGVTDFLVVCDETNNTPEVIDRNEFVAELYLKPTRSINYVTVTVTATRTGVSFSEVIGR